MINWLIQNYQVILAGIPAFIALASIVVRLTPTHDDDNALQWLIDMLGRFGVYRDNGDGSYNFKVPVVHSAAPADAQPPTLPPGTGAAIILVCLVSAAACASPLNTAARSYAAARETYRTTVVEVAVDLRAANQVSDAQWKEFLTVHEKIRRVDAALLATLKAAQDAQNAADKERLTKDAGEMLATLAKLVADAGTLVDAWRKVGAP